LPLGWRLCFSPAPLGFLLRPETCLAPGAPRKWDSACQTSCCQTAMGSLSLWLNYLPHHRECLNPKPSYSSSTADIGDRSATSSYEAFKKIFRSLQLKASVR
jgi:hypothetical protein